MTHVPAPLAPYLSGRVAFLIQRDYVGSSVKRSISETNAYLPVDDLALERSPKPPHRSGLDHVPGHEPIPAGAVGLPAGTAADPGPP